MSALAALLNRTSEFVVHRRRLVMVLSLILFAFGALGALRLQTDFTVEDLFSDYETDKQAAQRFSDTFGSTHNTLVVIYRAEDVFEPRHLIGIKRLSTDLGETFPMLAQVESVATLPFPPGRTLEQAAEFLSSLKPLRGRLVNHDGTLTLISTQLSKKLERNQEVAELISQIQSFLISVELPKGATLELAGLPYLRKEIIDKLKADQSLLLPLAIIFCVLVMLFSFRWGAGVVSSVFVVGGATGTLVGGMAWAGVSIDILNNIVPVLMLIIGLSDAIHLISRYLEETDGSASSAEASKRSMRAMAVACFFTSLTTAIGFASLVPARTAMLSRFGLIAAIGVILLYLTTVLVLPALLAGQKPRPKRIRDGSLLGGISARIVACSLRYRVAVIAATAVLAGVFSLGANRIEVDEAVILQFDEGDPVRNSFELLESEFRGASPVEVALFLPADRPAPKGFANQLGDLESWFKQQPSVLGVYSILDILRGARRISGLPGEASYDDLLDLLPLLQSQDNARRFVSNDGLTFRLQVSLKDAGAKATLAFAKTARQELESGFDGSGISYYLGGDALVSSRGLFSLIDDLLVSLLTAFFTILLILSFLFRSVRLAMFALLANLFPLLATLAYMSYRDISLSTATVIIFALGLGLAVDGSIHMMARIRESLRSKHSMTTSLTLAAQTSGHALVISSLTIIFGFSMLTLSEFVPMRRFGELIAVMVGFCLLSTLCLLPALLSFLGGESCEP